MTEEELYHFGIKGMKWGVRRFQNKDGSLTPAGKKHVADYRNYRKLEKNVQEEAKRLIKSDKRLKKDFGDGTDDEEYLEYIAASYGINTKKLRTAMVNSSDFRREHSESINEGRKIVKKLFKEQPMYFDRDVDVTGSHGQYMRS